MKLYKRYITVLLSLMLVFMTYNFQIYFSKSNYGILTLSQKAIEGETLWLQNNCNSCHQIYGLGGYLGPDLTNVYSHRNYNDNYIKGMLVSGVQSMPQFRFSPQEQEALLQYLKEVDATGYFPAEKAQIKFTGWIELDYKDNSYEK